MVGRLLALAARAPRATLGALLALAVCGAAAGLLVPVDGRLDRLAPSGSSVQRAGELERTSFGGDAATVLIRGDMVQTLRNPADLARLVGLEGCLRGRVPDDVDAGPCARVRDLDAVVSVQGPATFAQSAIVGIQDAAAGRLQQTNAIAEEARRSATAAAKKRGATDAQAADAGEAAAGQAQLEAIASLSDFIQETGLSPSDFVNLTILNRNLVTQILFARGEDRKLGPKRRLAFLIPNRETAIIQVNLRGDLSAGKRAEITEALQDVVRNPAFTLSSTGAEIRFTGLAPATQTLSDSIRRSALVLGGAALLVMGIVLAFVRRLAVRLLPVLVAAATLGVALLLLGIPTGSLSLAVVVTLPVLVGLAVDQAVQAQLRLQRRADPRALRTLVIAGSAASASALALLASPFGVVRTVAVAIAASILVAIAFAATASSAALALRSRRAEALPAVARASSLVDGVARAAPFRVTGRAASATTARVAAMGRAVAVVIVLAALAVAAGGVAVAGRTDVETDLASLVPPSSDGARELRTLQREIGFASSASLVVSGDRLGSPAVWRYLVQAQRTLTDGRARCDGSGLCSPLPLDELFGTTPDGPLPTDEQISSTLLALPDSLSRSLIDPDRGVIALPFGVGTLDGDRQRALVDELRTVAADAPAGTTVGVAGLPAVVDASARALESPGRRLVLAGLALLLPALVLAGTLRSVRRVVVALVPPALALGWSELALWALGVPRTPLTAALGVLVVAVAVEFSVLLSERFSALRAVGLPRSRAITSTLQDTGGAVAISAGATIAGFAVLGAAPIPVIAEFGIATAVDLLLVLVALLIVAPATWILADRTPAASRVGQPASTSRAEVGVR